MKNKSIEEKIYFLLKEIDEKRQITTSNEPIIIPRYFKGRAFDTTETQTILRKLEKDDKIISIINIDDGVIRVGYKKPYHGHVFNVTDKFNEYYESIQEIVFEPKRQILNGLKIKNKIESFSNCTIGNYIILLNTIKDKYEITPSNESIKIDCTNYYYEDSQIDSTLVKSMIKKLESDFNVIKIIKFDRGDYITGYGNPPSFTIKIFEEQFLSFLKLVEGKYKPSKGNTNKEPKNSLKITYSESSREIIINNFFLIAKPDFDSENEQVFHYLYRNSNRLINKGKIIEDLKITLTKDFSKIIENLNFKKDLRKAFFDVSKDSIKFYNPVSKERLQELGIKNIAIKTK